MLWRRRSRYPNLDNFSRESIRYTGMYTTIGVSSPSRAALITGMYPTSIGANNMRTAQNKSKPAGIHPYDVVLPAGIKCYTEQMRAAGYFCTNNSKTDYQFAAPLTAWDEQGDREWTMSKGIKTPFPSHVSRFPVPTCHAVLQISKRFVVSQHHDRVVPRKYVLLR